MKNKNLQQEQLEINLKLIEVVNSKEEFDFLEAEIKQLLNFYRIERRCA